jgi:hypothetical protein
MSTNKENTIHLQGIGTHHAKPASELQVGDVTVWNQGYTETVLDVMRVSPMFIRIATTSARDPDRVFYRRLKLDRLIAVTK